MSHQRDLSPKEAAALIGCGVDFIREEIRRKRLSPVYRVNRRVIRIPFSTAEAYKRSKAA